MAIYLNCALPYTQKKILQKNKELEGIGTFYFRDKSGARVPSTIRAIIGYFVLRKYRFCFEKNVEIHENDKNNVLNYCGEYTFPYEISKKFYEINRYHTKFSKYNISFNEKYFQDIYDIFHRSTTAIQDRELGDALKTLDKYIGYLKEINKKYTESLKRSRRVEMDTVKMALSLKGY